MVRSPIPIITVPLPTGCTSPPSTWQRPQSSSAPPSQTGNSSAANTGWNRYTASMIIVSGTRAGLVIGLIVTPLKIQHDGSRWNKKFGNGGSSMLVGSADSHTSPTSWVTSALVIPPIRNSATTAGPAVPTHSRPRREAVIPTCRSLRMWPHTQSLASGLASASASSFSISNTSTPRSRITSANMSCSAFARATQITSSNSSSPAFDGVSRVCSRPGRCTSTRRSLPTSEWTPSGMLITSLRDSGRVSGPGCRTALPGIS